MGLQRACRDIFQVLGNLGTKLAHWTQLQWLCFFAGLFISVTGHKGHWRFSVCSCASTSLFPTISVVGSSGCLISPIHDFLSFCNKSNQRRSEMALLPFQTTWRPALCGCVFVPLVNIMGVICCPNVEQIHLPHLPHWTFPPSKSHFTLVPVGHCQLYAMLLFNAYSRERENIWKVLFQALML